MNTLTLKRPAILSVGHTQRPESFQLKQLVIIILIAGAIYGCAMGTYTASTSIRPLQMLYSAAKVPLLLLISFTLTLPASFVFNTLFGLRDDWPAVLRSLLVTQAVIAVVLAALSPYTLLCYASTGNYAVAQLFNLLMFTAASLTGQAVLRRCYGPMIRKRPAHRYVMWSWLAVYAFVGVQMGWVLRPFIGSPSGPTQFFRDEPFSNAYVVIVRIIWKVMNGS